MRPDFQVVCLFLVAIIFFAISAFFIHAYSLSLETSILGGLFVSNLASYFFTLLIPPMTLSRSLSSRVQSDRITMIDIGHIFPKKEPSRYVAAGRIWESAPIKFYVLLKTYSDHTLTFPASIGITALWGAIGLIPGLIIKWASSIGAQQGSGPSFTMPTAVIVTGSLVFMFTRVYWPIYEVAQRNAGTLALRATVEDGDDE